MTPKKKQRVIEAFNAMLSHSPTADTPYDDIVAADGTPMTPRKALQKGVADGTIFSNVEDYLKKHPGITFDQFVDTISQPRPPASRHFKI